MNTKNINSVTEHEHVRIYLKSFCLCDCFPTTLNSFFNIKREERTSVRVVSDILCCINRDYISLELKEFRFPVRFCSSLTLDTSA